MAYLLPSFILNLCVSSYLSEVPVGSVRLNLAFLSHSTICLLIGDVSTLTVTADMVEFASIVLLLVFYLFFVPVLSFSPPPSFG